MKERAVTLGGASLALVLVIGLLVPTPPIKPPSSKPHSSDVGRHGYHALYRWLEHAGIGVTALRQRYHRLPEIAPGTGHILISVLPSKSAARTDEVATLKDWVSKGNTVLLLVAGVSAPNWVYSGDYGETDTLPRALGLDVNYEHGDNNDADEADRGASLVDVLREPSASPLTPIGDHPLLTEVREVATESPQTFAAALTVTPRHETRVVPALLKGRGPQGENLWSARAGDGRVIVLADPAVFANGLIAEADNARLIDNIIRLTLGPDRMVIFDDMHQGLTEIFDPRAFVHDSRAHISLAFLIGFWLLWIIGHNNRFGPLAQTRTLESSAAYARALGGLYARQATSNDVVRQLIAHLERECRRSHPQVFVGRTLPDALDALVGMPAEAIDGLRSAQKLLEAGQTPDLIVLTNHIRRLRNRL